MLRTAVTEYFRSSFLKSRRTRIFLLSGAWIVLVAAVLVVFEYTQAFIRVRAQFSRAHLGVFSFEILDLWLTPIKEIVVERNRRRTVRSETLRRLSITRVPIIIITGDYYVVYRPWNLIITK